MPKTYKPRRVDLMLDDAAVPAPRRLQDVELSNYPAGAFVSYVCFDDSLSTRRAIMNAANPARELLNRKHMTIKEPSDLLGCAYRTCRDRNSGKSKPPAWVLSLVVDKVLDD